MELTSKVNWVVIKLSDATYRISTDRAEQKGQIYNEQAR